MCFFTKRSKDFITRDVSAIGRKSFNIKGLETFGTGTIVDVFHITGTIPELYEALKISVKTGANWAAQCFKTLPHILSGPGFSEDYIS